MATSRSFNISRSEREFITEGIAQNMRADGRGRLDYRHFTLETGIISQTNGSARLKIASTDIVVGIKLETCEPKEDSPNEGIIQCSVECCPSASPEFEGKGAETLNNELASILQRTMNGALNLKDLCIIPHKLCWILYIDALVLDSGGNLFDSISMATYAALSNTLIPKIQVDEEQGEFQVDDDPFNSIKLDISNVPICITFTKIGTHYVVDSSIEEELCMYSRITIAVNRKGKICTIQKGGNGGLDHSSIYEMLSSARKIGQHILEVLDKTLKHEESLQGKRNKVGFFN